MIDLSTPLSLASSFRFPLQSPESRREIAWGALLLVLLPGVGWFLNMGHRIVVVHRMQHGEPPWPAWKNYPQLLGHGLITFGGMLYYSAPGLALAYVSWALRSRAAAVAAAGCWWPLRSPYRATCLTTVASSILQRSTIP